MAPTSEEKPISSRNICSRRGKRVPSREGWEQMEWKSFSPSRRRAAGSEVHHLTRLSAGGCCRPGLHLHTCFSSCSKAGGEMGGRSALIVLSSKSKPDLDLVPEAMPLGMMRFSISAESQQGEVGVVFITHVKEVRTVCTSGGKVELNQGRER